MLGSAALTAAAHSTLNWLLWRTLADLDGCFSGCCVVTYPDGEPQFDGECRHGEWHGADPSAPFAPKPASLPTQATNATATVDLCVTNLPDLLLPQHR